MAMGIQRWPDLPSISSPGWKFLTQSWRPNLSPCQMADVCMSWSSRTAPGFGDGTTTSPEKRRPWLWGAGRKSRKRRPELPTLQGASCCDRALIRCSRYVKRSFTRDSRPERRLSQSRSRGSMRKAHWSSGYLDKIERRLVKNVYPWLGSCPIAEISSPEYIDVIHYARDRGVADTARRVRETCNCVFRHAVENGLIRSSENPAIDSKVGGVRTPPVKHYAAITDPIALGRLMQAICAYKGFPVVRAALRFPPPCAAFQTGRSYSS